MTNVTSSRRSGAMASTSRRRRGTTKSRITLPREKATQKHKLTLQELFPEYAPNTYTSRFRGQRDKHIADLKQIRLHRGLVLYLGAGVSQSVGLPSWYELVRDLTVGMMLRQADTALKHAKQKLAMRPEEVRRQWWDLQFLIAQSQMDDRPLLIASRAIKESFGDELPGIIASRLYRAINYFANFSLSNLRFEPALSARTTQNSRFPISPLLQAIVDLARPQRDVTGVLDVVNYNFDCILDEVLREQKVPCVTVLSGKDRIPESHLACYHVHGFLPIEGIPVHTVPDDRKIIGNFVFSEDDYHGEYLDPYRWSTMVQTSLLGRSIGLFIGMSMEDPDIRRLIDATHRQYPDRFHYAILPRRQKRKSGAKRDDSVLRNLSEAAEEQSFRSIGVHVIWVDDFSEIPMVLNRVGTLDS